MEQTLLLNATYEPLKVVHWQKAITLLVPGKGGGDLGLRPGDSGGVLQLQAALRHPPAPLHQDQAPVRLRAVFAGEHLRARQPHLPVLRRRVPDERADVRPRRAGRPGRPQGLGEHRHLLRDLQPQEGRAHAGRGGDAPGPGSRGGPTRCRRSASRSGCATRPTAGATTSTGTPSSTKPNHLAISHRQITRWRRLPCLLFLRFPLPGRCEGGRVTIPGAGFLRSTDRPASAGDRRRPPGARRVRVDAPS